jgi:hypothetical protein
MFGALLFVLGDPWALTGDFSHTEFLVRGIPSHPPLIGVAARVRDFGSTPGPSMAYLLAPGYHLLGRSAWALAASTGLLHAASLLAAVFAARRVGGLLMAACLALSLFVMSMSFGPRFFLEPWNVWVPIFAFVLFIVLVWGVLCGRTAMLPWALVVGSHCVQTHISYTVLVGGLSAVAAGWVVWRDVVRHDGDRRGGLRWLGVSAAAFAAMWALPVIEQLRSGKGNLRKVYEQFSDPELAAVGTRAAVKAMVSRFNLLGPWAANADRDPLASPNLVGFALFALLVGAGGWCAWRRRFGTEIRLYMVLGAATVLGLLSTMRIFGQFFEYVIRWMVPLVAVWVAAAVWSIARTLGLARLSAQRAAPVAAAAVLALSVAAVARAAPARVPYRADSDITLALAAQTAAELPADQRYQINEYDVVSLGSPAFGLQLELEKRGRSDGVGEWGRSGVKDFRVVTSDEADGELWYVSTPQVIAAFAALPGAEVVAEFDVRSDAARARSAQLWDQVVAALCDAGRDDLLTSMTSRWGFTALDYRADLPAGVRPVLRELAVLRQPAAVISLPVGAASGAIAVASPTCGR